MTTMKKALRQFRPLVPNPTPTQHLGKIRFNMREKGVKDNVHQSSHPNFFKFGLVKPSHTNSSFHQCCVIVSLL